VAPLRSGLYGAAGYCGGAEEQREDGDEHSELDQRGHAVTS
jgi:hypothetical protein